ncbi:efflux RND transporter periplasmic adaptor subunit [Chondrinema litorale]|uniref:efflux RND transporter periplasmic adaptor subunit n=1 Tax=Chondrinema litorale TaxID=2994555 RepID=UPI002543AECA|nr:efflux RND transporter periplasmic adaptor subunit [Chondrinema litorale]UZR99149.1 efflux RND transporter periplasmic adaptor subunit [Chondrinema litorale]
MKHYQLKELMYKLPFFIKSPFLVLGLFLFIVIGCKEKEEVDTGLALPVKKLAGQSAANTFQYLGSVEGIEDVEIRPQVDGILEEIYVDEGDFVEKGQPLFKINSQPYIEDLKNARANVALESARLKKSKTELDRLQPLIDNEVISDVKKKTAEADYEIAEASLAKAQAIEANMQIKLGFTTIKAPVSGFIGRIPKSVGNVIKNTNSEPLTILSNVSKVYVYFSMSESDYLYYERLKNDSTSKKFSSDVKLILADGYVYDHPGRIDANSGQLNRNTGSITLRAVFNNPDTLLRSGNTGKILMEQIYPNAILIPQSAAISIQDKKFVFILDENDMTVRKEIGIEGRSGKDYIISNKSLSENDRIVVSGLNKLTDGVKINPIQSGRLLTGN